MHGGSKHERAGLRSEPTTDVESMQEFYQLLSSWHVLALALALLIAAIPLRSSNLLRSGWIVGAGLLVPLVSYLEPAPVLELSLISGAVVALARVRLRRERASRDRAQP